MIVTRYAVSAVLLIAFFIALALTPRTETAGAAVARSIEDMLPKEFAGWRQDESIGLILPREEDTLAGEIYDQTLARAYRNERDELVMLVIAYGARQSDALQLHRPEVCYAAQGFLVSDPRPLTMSLAPGVDVPLVRLKTRFETRREPVTYWTRVGEEMPQTTMGRQWAKLSAGLKGLVPDGVLVRVSSISRDEEAAFELQARFISDMMAAMSSEAHVFLLGTERGTRYSDYRSAPQSAARAGEALSLTGPADDVQRKEPS